MGSVAAIVAVAAGVGVGVAAERSGVATPAGSLGRAGGVDISGGAVGKIPSVPGIPELPPEVSTDEINAGIRKRRVGAIGSKERGSTGTSLLSSGISNTLGE